VSGSARRDIGSAKYHLIVLEAARLFGWERHVVQPVSPKVGTGDFAFAAGHRRIVISPLSEGYHCP
jgi:hypothetical protein